MLHRRATLTARAIVTTVLLAAAASTVASTAAAQEAGQWEITPIHRDGRVLGTVNLAFSQGEDSNMSLGPISLSELRGLTAAQLNGSATDVRFQLAAPAGTVSFTGMAGHGRGTGDYTFAPNRAFGAALSTHGIQGVVDDYDLFRLAIRDVTVGQVDTLIAALRQNGDVLPDVNGFVRLLNHDVDAGVVADLGGAGLRGLEPEQIIRLVNHDVDSHYIQALRAAGYTTRDTDTIVRLHNHGVALRGDADAGTEKHKDKRSDG